MSFKVNPLNGWVVVSEMADTEQTVAFILPESVTEKSEYVVMMRQSSMLYPVIVPRHMIVEISHMGKKFQMVEEKYILGEIEKTHN